MDKAVYHNRVLKANELTPEEYKLTYKGNLYCTTPNCQARLVHVQVDKHKKAYFKTLQGDNHLDTCPNHFDRISGEAGYIYSYEETGLELSESHAKNVLKDTFKKMMGKEKITTSSSTKKKTSKIVSEKKKNKVKETYKSGGKVGSNNGTRQPSIGKRDIQTFLDAKKGTYSVYGYIKNIEVFEDYIYLTIADNSLSLRLYIGNIFINNNQPEFNLLKKLCTRNSLIDIPFVAICHKTFHNSEPIGEIVDYKTIFLNGLFFYEFIKSNS